MSVPNAIESLAALRRDIKESLQARATWQESAAQADFAATPSVFNHCSTPPFVSSVSACSAKNFRSVSFASAVVSIPHVATK